MDPDLAQLLIRIQGNDTVRIRWVLIRNTSVKNAVDLIVVPPPPGPVGRDVLCEHAEGAAAAQPQDLHLPPLRPLLLRHLLCLHHPALHEGWQERHGRGEEGAARPASYSEDKLVSCIRYRYRFLTIPYPSTDLNSDVLRTQ